MKHVLIALLCTGFSTAAFSQTAPAIPSAEAQIKAAVMAAPADKRDGAAVYGYTQKGYGLLRKGTNEMICLADDPAQKGLSVVCYHRDLDAFMERGRQLRKRRQKPAGYF